MVIKDNRSIIPRKHCDGKYNMSEVPGVVITLSSIWLGVTNASRHLRVKTF